GRQGGRSRFSGEGSFQDIRTDAGFGKSAGSNSRELVGALFDIPEAHGRSQGSCSPAVVAFSLSKFNMDLGTRSRSCMSEKKSSPARRQEGGRGIRQGIMLLITKEMRFPL